ncbi:MAG: HAD-IC family P-type ATPase, partial [Bosea sp. (in: a-proteobacteria)]|uniref:HAD-IC family P-type ATPase n=1 Tax=Bosea sp. (in: a-proteobacteria) TaxID=1871050 RepID=UPI003F7BE1BF
VRAYRNGDWRLSTAWGAGLRPRARETVAALQEAGFAIMILSGDRPQAVAPVAAALGITEARAGLLPGGKLDLLDGLARKGRKVLMVGDGLNDAPALAASHVSISPVSASHLAQSAADIVFLGDSLAPVVQAVAIGRKARRLMIQNLWLAVLYNAIAVPVAIAGLVTPLIAAAAMSGSSLVVTLNALRARSTGGGSAP